MGNWSAKRVSTTQQYLRNIGLQLQTWEERLEEHTKGKAKAETMVVALRKSLADTKADMETNGHDPEPDVIPEPDFNEQPEIEQFMPDPIIPETEPEVIPEQPMDMQQRKARGVGHTYIRHRAARGEKKLYDE